MKILLIKTSSMGDVLHTLPALSDAQAMVPNLQCHWVVEDAFEEIPHWHPAVHQVIPIAQRRWRKNWLSAQTRNAVKHFIQKIRCEKYDAIIDAQGLLKSAWITALTQGVSHGLDWHSAREPVASLFYKKKYRVDTEHHAVMRTRILFAKSLHYTLPDTTAHYAIDQSCLPELDFSVAPNTIIFLHATTWASKHYPVPQWRRLTEKLSALGKKIMIPWGDAASKAQAEEIARDIPNAHVLPRKLSLTEISTLLTQAQAVVSVDTGLSHLAAALSVPTVSLYGPTDPNRTGTLGTHQTHLAADFPCAPCFNKQCQYKERTTPWSSCFETLTPEAIIDVLALSE